MAQTKRKSEWEAGQPPVAIAAERTLAAGQSPARALQELLAQRADAYAGEARWSRRRSLAFIVAASTSLWMAILVAARSAITLAA